MAVPYITRARRWVEREWIEPGNQVRIPRVLRCKADLDSSDLSGRADESVLPAALPRRERFREPRQEIMDRTCRRVEHWSLHVGSHRWMIERKRRTVEALPVGFEAINVDILSILQQKLDQVDVYWMGIFRQVLEVPRLRRADVGGLGDIGVKMLSVEEHRHRLADGAFLLVQGEELWIPDALGLDKRGNSDQCGGQGRRVRGRRIQHLESHDDTGRVRINGIAALEGRIGGVLENDLRSGRNI